MKVLTSKSKVKMLTVGDALALFAGVSKVKGDTLTADETMDYIDMRVSLDRVMEDNKSAFKILFSKYGLKSEKDLATHPQAIEIQKEMARLHEQPVKTEIKPLNFLSRESTAKLLASVDIHMQLKMVISKFLRSDKT